MTCSWIVRSSRPKHMAGDPRGWPRVTRREGPQAPPLWVEACGRELSPEAPGEQWQPSRWRALPVTAPPAAGAPQLGHATVNIGVIGHVANGKSTLVRRLTSVATAQHSSDKKRNCTIHLGYANCKIFECRQCAELDFGPSAMQEHACGQCDGGWCELIRHVSFVDCPGHDQLISTMINGAAVMDGALLVTAANEPCPQPQTVEHLMAAELLGVQDYVKIQNKVDLVSNRSALREHAEALEALTEGTHAHEAPLVPVVAQTGANMDAVVRAIATQFRAPSRDLAAPLRLAVIRTFKVSAPGMEPRQLRGGVLGGSIIAGVARVGDLLELRPGLLSSDEDGTIRVTPLYTRVQSLQCEAANLEVAVPGGLVGVQTDLDPQLCLGDRLVGQVAGAPGSLPPVLSHLAVSFQKLKRVDQTSKLQLSKGSHVVLHVGSAETGGTLIKQDKTKDSTTLLIRLQRPVCCEEHGQRVTVFVEKRLVGFGTTVGGKPVQLPAPPSLDQLMCAPTLCKPDKPSKATAKPEATARSSLKSEPAPEPAPNPDCVKLFGSKKKRKPKARGGSPQAPNQPPAEPKPAENPEVATEERPTEEQPKRAKAKKKKRSPLAEQLPAQLEIRVESAPEPVAEKLAAPEPESLKINLSQLASSCRFYQEKLPEPQQVVTAVVDRTGPHGVHVKLPEFCSAEAFIPMSELTRKNRVRNLRALASPGQELVCSVTSVDPINGHIDLTKSRVTKQEVSEHSAKYSEAVLAHQVLCRAAVLLSDQEPTIALTELYNTVAWPLAARHGDVYAGLLAAVADSGAAFGSITPEPTVWETLISEAARRLKPKPMRCYATLRLSCTAPLGVHAVRTALCNASRLMGDAPVSLKVDVPPVYRLSCETDPKAAATLLWRAVRIIEAEAARLDCQCELENPPQVIEGRSELAELEEPAEDSELDAALATEPVGLAGADGRPGKLTAPTVMAGGMPSDLAKLEAQMACLDCDEATDGEDSAECSEQPESLIDSEDRWHIYEELLDHAFDSSGTGPPKLRLSALDILIRPKHTLVANFGVICQQLQRPIPHLMLFLTSELGTSASVRGDGCGLVLRGRFKPNQVEVLVRRYCKQHVKCGTCGSFSTQMSYDSSIRRNIQCCQHCTASCTLANIRQPTYQAQIGRRKK